MSKEVEIHKCTKCSGQGWTAVPSMIDPEGYDQECCGYCHGAGSVVELEDGTIVPNN